MNELIDFFLYLATIHTCGLQHTDQRGTYQYNHLHIHTCYIFTRKQQDIFHSLNAKINSAESCPKTAIIHTIQSILTHKWP